MLVASRRLENFLIEAGVMAEQRQRLLEMYLFAKGFYRSTAVQILLEEGQTDLNGVEMGVYHVPGHCPGQVCLQVDDVLLTADHILAQTTPHQAPGPHSRPHLQDWEATQRRPERPTWAPTKGCKTTHTYQNRHIHLLCMPVSILNIS